MESKYYIPDIEEFHIGFNYEFRNYAKSKFIDCKLGEVDDWSLSEIMTEIEENKIRVKYLDQQDIESLGWKEVDSDYGMFENKQYKKYGQDCYYYLILFKDSTIVTIRHIGNNIDFGNIHLEIKNKSELKKLMKQLQING